MDITQNVADTSLIISGEPWIDFLLRFAINIISTFVLIRFIYYPNNNRVKYLFTFFLMGVMLFLIASILDKVELDIGLAFGLFAIFGIIRFRSPSIDLKEMTYLFLVIGLAIINALVEFRTTTIIGLAFSNVVVLSATFFMEKYRPKNYVLKRSLVFSPSCFSILNNNKALLQEVQSNTGIDVLRVEISKINKVKNEVTVLIYFNENNKDFAVELTTEEQILEEPTPENSIWESTSSDSYK